MGVHRGCGCVGGVCVDGVGWGGVGWGGSPKLNRCKRT